MCKPLQGSFYTAWNHNTVILESCHRLVSGWKSRIFGFNGSISALQLPHMNASIFLFHTSILVTENHQPWYRAKEWYSKILFLQSLLAGLRRTAVLPPAVQRNFCIAMYYPAIVPTDQPLLTSSTSLLLFWNYLKCLFFKGDFTQLA